MGAFYRRLSARIGKAKAVTATARKIAVLFYNALRHGIDYVDPGASYYEIVTESGSSNLPRRAKAFGYILQPHTPAPRPPFLRKAAVDLSDERNAVCKLSGWRHEAKRFPRPGVKSERNGIQIGLAVGG